MSIFYPSSSFPNQPDSIRVIIDDVDVANGVAHARDQTAAIIQVRFNEAPGGTMFIPKAGQTWTAVRRGYTWHLDGLVNTNDLSDYQPGTVVIDAPGGIILNGSPLRGGVIVQEQFTNLNSGFTSVVLTKDPIEISTIIPYLNGLAVMPDLWTFNQETRTLTFDTELGEIGHLVVTYQAAENEQQSNP